ncbi:MAG: CoA-binding protein [Deltaproteobacteria bacterium]|nr:CoA-binding protein [Deltaproteobacteria bacterium]
MMAKTGHFLDSFFMAKTVAVVGATNNPFKMNYKLVSNLANLGFKGKIYPVNPREKMILGMNAFKRLRDIPDKIDLVISAIPAEKTMGIVEECSLLDIKQLVIVTGGFSEGGDKGKRLHKQLNDFVKEKGIRVLGPNTLSPVNSANNLIISFNPVTKIIQGGLSFAYQSGFYDLRLGWLCSHYGIAKMIDMGNKMDINEVDALEYLGQDPETKVIAMHMESLRGDGRNFFNLLKRISFRKPTIILKSGRTPGGSHAAASHTGVLSGENDIIFDSMLRQTAAVRAQNLDDFFDLSKAFGFFQLPGGNRLSIITLSGGEGVMATDACETSGLKLAKIGDKTSHKLEEILPLWEIPLNPFDAGVCMEFHLTDIRKVFDSLVYLPEDENVDFTIMQMPPPMLMAKKRELSEEVIIALRQQYVQMFLNLKEVGKPFALWRTSVDKEEDICAEMLELRGVPVFETAERAIKALSHLYQYRQKIMSHHHC